MAIRNIKLTIQYDGTAYHGWQAQPGVDTIQGQIETAMEKLCRCRVTVNGSSRTDAGVHALGQVANVKVDTPVPTENLVKALNNLLPADIAVTEAIEAEKTFDAISDTRSKLYRYTIYTKNVRNVMKTRYCWHRPGKLDTKKTNAAAQILVGKKDFTSFASAADRRESSIRTIIKCDVSSDGSFIYIDVHADGFLYNMVRNIVGTLVEVGRGRWEPQKIAEILEAEDRTAAGPIAPPGGLCLVKIEY